MNLTPCFEGCLRTRLECKRHLQHDCRVVQKYDGYAVLMRPDKAEAAVHGCHCQGDMAVRMREVLAIPRSCIV